MVHLDIYIYWMWPPHRIPVVNEGLGWDLKLSMSYQKKTHQQNYELISFTVA